MRRSVPRSTSPRLRTRARASRKAKGGRSGKRLSHLDGRGQARMVDVGPKKTTEREAVASARVRLKPSTLTLILDGKMDKGDVFAAARLAGILGTKATPRLIPLCHPLPITGVSVDFKTRRRPVEIEITCRVKTRARTGVEMEALTGAAVAALTLYDMCKSVDRGMKLLDIRLDRKAGGKSGLFVRGTPDS